MHLFRMIVCLALWTAALLAWPGAAVGGAKSDSKVKASIKADKPGADGTQKIAITLAVDKGWYIYANPVRSEDFEPNETKVTLKAKGQLKYAVTYPPETEKTETIGKDTLKYRIYQDSVVIEARVQRTPGDASPLQVKIDVNACSIGKDGKTAQCLLPGTIMLTVP